MPTTCDSLFPTRHTVLCQGWNMSSARNMFERNSFGSEIGKVRTVVMIASKTRVQTLSCNAVKICF
jgi:hypothetical protein